MKLQFNKFIFIYQISDFYQTCNHVFKNVFLFILFVFQLCKSYELCFKFGWFESSIFYQNITLFIMAYISQSSEYYVPIYTSGVAWTIIPYTFRIENDYFLFKSWNLFIIMCSFPSIILAYLLMRLPESPKFLLSQGKHDETIDCLKFVHRWNNKTDVKFPVSRSHRYT